MNKLFYEVESEYFELKNKLLDRLGCDYGEMEENITIKDFLDFGFNNSYIDLEVNGDIERFNLGFKNCNKCIEYGYSVYESKDFTLNEEQLQCEIGNVYYDTDSMDYTIMFVSLKNKNDVKKFIDNEGKCK